MSWDNNPFDEDPRKAIRKWLGDFLPESMFQQIDEMMDRMMQDLSEGGMLNSESMEEFMRNPEGTNPFCLASQCASGKMESHSFSDLATPSQMEKDSNRLIG